MRAEGLDGWFDAATYDLLDRIDTAPSLIPPTDPPMGWDLAVADAQVEVADGPRITGVGLRGHVVGSIRAKRVMLQASSQVEGDIYHQALSIEQGAMFEGKSRRSADDPRAGAAAPNTAMRASPPDLQH